MVTRKLNIPKSDDKPWSMDELQREFDRIVREAREGGTELNAKQLARAADHITRSVGGKFHRALTKTAPSMLTDRRSQREGFEKRNLRRWRKAFDLVETIWVSCEELGRVFSQHHRPRAVLEQDHVFEAVTHLHAKALLVTAEIICLMKGGFADGALARWRTLYEINVIATLIRQGGQELALKYLAHSRVQAWKRVKDEQGDPAEEEERKYLQTQAEYAIERFGPELNRRNGWACEVTGKKQPTFENLAELVGATHGKMLYHDASLHIHGNHRALDELLGVCENQQDVLLVGPSNSGMVTPLTLAAMSIVESTSLLLLTEPNFDRVAFVNTLIRMAGRMHRLASGIERRTFHAAQNRITANG